MPYENNKLQINYMKKTKVEESCAHDEFLPCLNSILFKARLFGISTIGLNTWFLWTTVIFIMLIALEVAAIWKFVRLLTDIAANSVTGRGIVARLSGSIFYGNALLSLLLCCRCVYSWKTISLQWLKIETTGLHLPGDNKIRGRMLSVTFFIGICAFVEHILSMISATGVDCPPEDYFKRYILSSHGFLLHPHEYNLWVAIPIFVLSKLATILWNFQDLLIILISMGLSSRYHRMNCYVGQIVRVERKRKKGKRFGTDSYMQVKIWRQIREAYCRTAALVRMVDKELGSLVLLCNVNNLYFICLQLFLGLHKDKGSLINKLYYYFSLSWLVFRACSVVMAASDVLMQSKQALPTLYSCPAASYNVEIRRLQYQLKKDSVALTGVGYFSLKRQLLLQVAATIVKYELVLLQYDK